VIGGGKTAKKTGFNAEVLCASTWGHCEFQVQFFSTRVTTRSRRCGKTDAMGKLTVKKIFRGKKPRKAQSHWGEEGRTQHPAGQGPGMQEGGEKHGGLRGRTLKPWGSRHRENNIQKTEREKITWNTYVTRPHLDTKRAGSDVPAHR